MQSLALFRKITGQKIDFREIERKMKFTLALGDCRHISVQEKGILVMRPNRRLTELNLPLALIAVDSQIAVAPRLPHKK